MLPTRADYFEIGADEVLARSAARPPGQRLDAEQVRVEGSDINIVIASASAMAEEATRRFGLRLKALFVDGAEGEDLDRLVADRFAPEVVRRAAFAAVVTLSFFRTSGGFPATTIPTGTRVRSTNGVEFETTSTATIPAGSPGPVTAPARAVAAGLNGNVAAATLTTFVATPSDPALQVTNPERAAGGDDSETDARLRSRARDFWRTARRGTLSAIEFGALTVPGVRQATAIEEVDSSGDPTGRVALYIADALGGGNAALVTQVRAALVEYRAAGVIVDVTAASPVFTPIRYRLRFSAGVDTTAAADQIRLTTIAVVNALRPAETLEVAALFEVARSVPGVIVLSDAIVEPVGDVIPAAGQVIRTSADLVTFE